MKIKTFILILFIHGTALRFEEINNELSNVSNGKLEQIENFPSKYVLPRNITIWLPEGYDKAQKYSVVYMHDGQMLFDSTATWNKQEWGIDEAVSKLIAENKIKQCIVVGIWNTGKGRHSDYFPQKPFENFSRESQDIFLQIKYNEVPLFEKKVRSDNYLKFIVEELKPYIDKNYSTYSDRSNTFISGSSMGALISWYALCEYPQIFGGAACLSTHWIGVFTKKHNPIPDEFFKYLRDNLPEPSTHKIYFDYGTETLDSLYEPYQKQVDAIMIEEGYNSINWQTIKFEGENHSEIAWKKRIHIPLHFLLGK